MSDTPNQNPFDQMREGLTPPDDPGYLQYWEMRAGNDIDDERIAQIITGLTRVALHGESGQAAFTDREPALQARYWYRSLGPLNPLVGVEADLVTAADMMYGKRVADPTESANLEIDSIYALADLARVTDNPKTIQASLRLATQGIRAIRSAEGHNELDASYRLQAAILEGDLWHDALRMVHSGQLDPKEMGIEDYRNFEKEFVKRELTGIEDFGRLVDQGVTEENFGILFEWYFILARRHRAWMDEELDTVQVRGATSRENAEWTGEFDVNPRRITGNHDIVISSAKKSGGVERQLLQLKAVKGNDRRYHPRVKVIDFQEALDARFRSIDDATNQLVKNLVKLRKEYREE